MSNDPYPALDSMFAHYEWVRQVARRLVLDESQADDLVQDTWVAALKRPPDLSRDPRAWLKRVLRNKARNQHRGTGRRTRHEALVREQRPVRSPDEIVAETELHQRVVDVVMSLGEPHRSTILVRFYEGLTPAEIATRYDVPIGTVHSRLHRAVEQMRNRLDAKEGGDRQRWVVALLPLAQAPQRALAGSVGTTTVSAGLIAMLAAKPKILVALSCLLLLAGSVVTALLLNSEVPGAPALTAEAPLAAEGVPTLAGTGEGGAATAGRPPSEDAASGARKHPAVAVLDVRGRVIDPDGKPVADAEVFALPGASPGVEARVLRRARFGRVRTGADGTFHLRTGPIRGAQIIAYAEGYLAASADAMTAPADGVLELRLGAPRRIQIQVDDGNGYWPVGAGVHLSTDPDTTHDRVADPMGQYAYADYEAEVERREPVTLEIASEALITLEVYAPSGLVAVPGRQVLDAGVTHVDVRLVPSARLRVKVVPAEGTAPFAARARFSVSLHRSGSAEVLLSRSQLSPDFEFRTGLGPEPVRLEVISEGRETWVGELDFQRAGEEQKVVVALDLVPALEARARVRIRTTPGKPVPADVAAQAGRFPDEGTLRWIVLARTQAHPTWRHVRAEDGPGGNIRLDAGWFGGEVPGLEAGTYDFLVAQRGTGRAGIAKAVRIFADQDNDIDVRMEPGCYVPLSAVLDPDRPRTKIEIWTGVLGPVPAYDFGRGSTTAWTWPDAPQDLAAVPLVVRVFGPFPGASVEVRAQTSEGKQERVTVRGAGAKAR